MTLRSFAAALWLLGLTLFGLSFTSYAQLGGAEPLTLELTPAYPRPYQTVTVTPQSTLFDLAASTVVVTVNGTEVFRGSGAEPAYISAGAPGSATTVTVRATTNGQTYTRSTTVRPAEVSLIVEPVSTAHPFYVGGTPVASEGRVRLVALADLRTSGGTRIATDSLVYTWRNGEQILQASSGIGKSVLPATAPVRYRDARITVTVSSQDKSVVAESAVTVSPSDPSIRVYRHDPLLGPLFGTALGSEFALQDTEETFRAVPYFFPEQASITWQVNGTQGDNDQDITVRATGAGSGAALLAVHAEASGSARSADTRFRVRFGERKSFSIFGL